MTVEQAKAQLMEAEHKVELLQAAHDDLHRDWRQAIEDGASDEEAASMETALDAAKRDIERATIRAGAARRALEQAEAAALKAKQKAAVDNYLKLDAELRKAIETADASGDAYSADVAKVKKLVEEIAVARILCVQAGDVPFCEPLPDLADAAMGAARTGMNAISNVRQRFAYQG